MVNLPPWPETVRCAPPKFGETVRLVANGNPEPSPAPNREGVEARRVASKGPIRTYDEGMVQRTNAASGGRESVGAMKGEVVRSIRTGSTIAKARPGPFLLG